MLKLPVTIRAPRLNEMADRPDLPELMEKRSRANIVPGYKLKKNNTPQLPYHFQADINIDNSKLWALFSDLSALLPPTSCFEFGAYGNEPVTTRYLDSSFIIQRISSFERELSQDGFLSFGLRSFFEGRLTEIAVTESKYIQYWYSGSREFSEVMDRFGLKNIENIAFIDEFPKIIEPLQKFIPQARPPGEVIRELNRIFL